MSPFFKKILAALGATFLPPRHPGDWHGGDATSVAIITEFTGRAPWWMRIAFSGGLLLVNVCPLFVIGTPRTFLGLDEATRLRYLNRFVRQPPFALLFAPLRAVLGICIYARPDAMKEIGYSNAGRA